MHCFKTMVQPFQVH